MNDEFYIDKVISRGSSGSYEENYYNSNKSRVFEFSFIAESEILQYCKKRCEMCSDELTIELYEKYIEGAMKELISNEENSEQEMLY